MGKLLIYHSVGIPDGSRVDGEAVLCALFPCVRGHELHAAHRVGTSDVECWHDCPNGVKQHLHFHRRTVEPYHRSSGGKRKRTVKFLG